MLLICHVIDVNNSDHLANVVSAKFFHRKVIISSFVITNYLVGVYFEAMNKSRYFSEKKNCMSVCLCL